MSPTKVMRPMEWAFPPVPVEREVLSRPAASPSGRPPLLFVHGLCHGAWCFDEHWMLAAAERGWDTFAVSLRAHGNSGGYERWRRSRFRDYEHDVLQAIADLPEPPVLVAHSMGALVARRVAARYPARALVLVAPAGAATGLGIVADLAVRKPWHVARMLALQPVRFDADDLFARLPDEEASRHLARMVDDSPLAQLEIAFSPRPTSAACPVLVLGGGEDRLVPAAAVAATARAYGTRAHLFRGMGHDLMLDGGWQAPLHLMLDWLDDHLPT